MTILEVTPVMVDETETEDEPEVWHRLCCVDKRKTICGTPRLAEEFRQHDDNPTHSDCIICDVVWDTTTLCPTIQKCPHVTRARLSGEY